MCHTTETTNECKTLSVHQPFWGPVGALEDVSSTTSVVPEQMPASLSNCVGSSEILLLPSIFCICSCCGAVSSLNLAIMASITWPTYNTSTSRSWGFTTPGKTMNKGIGPPGTCEQRRISYEKAPRKVQF